jgi:hypothetical protein
MNELREVKRGQTGRGGPTFLCIGAQKSGTTWLYENLRTHPALWLPPEKELHYFGERAEVTHPFFELVKRSSAGRLWLDQLRRHFRDWRTNPSLSALRWYVHFFLASPSERWYLSLFEGGAGLVTGEITPAYATLKPAQVAEVHRLLPEVKVIFLMRNPIERAWSHARMQMHHGFLSSRPADIRNHLRDEESVARTDYLRTIDCWRTCFSSEEIFVGFVEDIHFRPDEFLRQVCAFLGVDSNVDWPYLHERVYTRSPLTIPSLWASELADLHGDLIVNLSKWFGGWAGWWQFCRDSVLNRPSGEELAFPLYESSLWQDWSGGAVPLLQSNTLDRAAATVDVAP